MAAVACFDTGSLLPVADNRTGGTVSEPPLTARLFCTGALGGWSYLLFVIFTIISHTVNKCNKFLPVY